MPSKYCSRFALVASCLLLSVVAQSKAADDIFESSLEIADLDGSGDIRLNLRVHTNDEASAIHMRATIVNRSEVILRWFSHDHDGYRDVDIALTDETGNAPALTPFGEKYFGEFARLTSTRCAGRKLQQGEFHTWHWDLKKCFRLISGTRYKLAASLPVEIVESKLKFRVIRETEFDAP